jgi:hypothetical protein
MGENTEGYKIHKRLIIKQIVKHFALKKGENTEGYDINLLRSENKKS